MMIVERHKLWDDPEIPSHYTAYLQDNSPEIDAERKHPALILCGGGGFLDISDREKEPVALAFLAQGFQVFMLDYCTAATGHSQFPQPLYDVSRLILTVRTNADRWNVKTDNVAVLGFSAGGTVAAWASTHWNRPYVAQKLGIDDAALIRPDAAILSYPITDFVYQHEHQEELGSPDLQKFLTMIFQAALGDDLSAEHMREANPIDAVTDETPATFLWQNGGDDLIFPQQNLGYAHRLMDHHVPVELHLFEKGPHGMSLGTTQSASMEAFVDDDTAQWLPLALRFLRRRFSSVATTRHGALGGRLPEEFPLPDFANGDTAEE